MKTLYRRGSLLLLSLSGILTLLLIGLGTFIASSGYGLAIPEWPLVQGRLIPPHLVAGIWYEFLHRAAAAATGLLTFLSGGWILAGDPRLPVRRLALMAMLLIAVQIVIGGLGVLWEFPNWLGALHAWAAPAFFGMLAALATVFTHDWQQDSGRGFPFDLSALRKTRTLALLILLQIALGAMVRQAESGGLYLVVLTLHLVTALLVTVFAIATSVSVLRQDRQGLLGLICWTLIPLALLQLGIGFGVLALAPAGPPESHQASAAYVAHTVVHALLAALLLGCSAAAAMLVRRKAALARPPRVVRVERSGLVQLD